MRRVRKSIITDADHRPVAVQIPYADWLEIERWLEQSHPNGQAVDWEKYRGVLQLRVDPLEYQKQIRAEWP